MSESKHQPAADGAIPQNPVALNGAQRRHLRGLGHPLKPVVRVGKHGVTEGVIEAAAVALDDHELIKLQIAGESKADRQADGELIARRTGSHFVQLLGGTALLYRRRLDGPEVPLPGAFEEARRVTPPKKRPQQPEEEPR